MDYINDEPRLYTIIPLKVNGVNPADNTTKLITMETGRLAAQCVHVGRKFEHEHMNVAEPFQEITTITLSVRNSLELDKIYQELLNNNFGDVISRWEDYNPAVYGSINKMLTAICFGPVYRAEVENIIGHLELYDV